MPLEGYIYRRVGRWLGYKQFPVRPIRVQTSLPFPSYSEYHHSQPTGHRCTHKAPYNHLSRREFHWLAKSYKSVKEGGGWGVNKSKLHRQHPGGTVSTA